MKKKNIYAFLIKKTPFCAGLALKQKTFSNFQATYKKELCLLFENQAIFFTWVNVKISLTPHHLFVLVRSLRTPPPSPYFLNDS